MSMENIGGKLYAEESYPIKDIGGGVVSKGQAIRHYEKMHSEHTVVSISSFKVDHETESVKIKVSVRPKTLSMTVAGVGGSEITGEKADNVGCGDRKPVALLNPGYDELKAKYDALVVAVGKDAQKFSDLLVENDKLKKQNLALAEMAGVDISPDAPDVQLDIKDGCEDHLTCNNCPDRNCEGRKVVE